MKTSKSTMALCAVLLAGSLFGPAPGAPIPTSCNVVHAQTKKTQCTEGEVNDWIYCDKDGKWVPLTDEWQTDAIPSAAGTCSQYQHMERAHCVDNYHLVTEREWIELQAKLIDLEDRVR